MWLVTLPTDSDQFGRVAQWWIAEVCEGLTPSRLLPKAKSLGFVPDRQHSRRSGRTWRGRPCLPPEGAWAVERDRIWSRPKLQAETEDHAKFVVTGTASAYLLWAMKSSLFVPGSSSRPSRFWL
jgi:hypothetical protein